MQALNRKLLRDVWHLRAQVLALSLVIGSGVAVLVMSLSTIEALSETVVKASLCALGKSAPNPVLSTLRYFRDEYETHIIQKKCPAGVCKDLFTFKISEETCTGCGACLKACPVDCITGEKKKLHTIDVKQCTRCGACRNVCRFDSVEVV